MPPNYNQTNFNPFSHTPPTFTPKKGNHQKTPQDKLRDFVQKHRTLTVIAVITAGILVLSGIILLIESRLPVKIEPEDPPATYFNHRYLLEYSIGRSFATQAFANLNTAILNPEAIASAPTENPDHSKVYNCNLIESSYKKLSDLENTYQVNLEISDGRTYTLTVRLSPIYGNYTITILDRTDSDSSPDYVFINTDTPDEYPNELNQWIETFNLTKPIISTPKITTEDID